MADAPKSAYEIVMERLRKKDAESGATEKPLTDEQRAAIAEARNVYEARVAERRIMQQAVMAATFDPAERELREQEFLRDMDRFATDRDSRIRKIREQSSS